MKRRVHVVLLGLVIAVAGAGLLSHAGDKEKGKQEPSSYIKLEAKGKLVRKNNFHYVEARDVTFPDSTLFVKLSRSEDKNRNLDEHLKSLEGKIVTVTGFMDCHKIDAKERIIDLRLSDVSQVKPDPE